MGYDEMERILSEEDDRERKEEKQWNKFSLYNLEHFLKWTHFCINDDFKILEEKLKEKKITFETMYADHSEGLIILLFEKAINDCYHKLEEIFEHGATHCHKGNMARTFMRLLKILEFKLQFLAREGDVLYILISKWIQKCQDVKKVFDPIHDVLISPATHAEKDLLLKPYWWDFWNVWCFALNGHKYSLKEEYMEFYDEVISRYIKLKQQLESSE